MVSPDFTEVVVAVAAATDAVGFSSVMVMCWVVAMRVCVAAGRSRGYREVYKKCPVSWFLEVARILSTVLSWFNLGE